MADNKSVYLSGPMQVVNGTMGDTSKPCTIVEINTSGQFVAATAASGNKELFVLDKQRARGQGIDSDSVVGDPARAFRLLTGLRTQIRVKAGTFAAQQALSVDASGQVAPQSGSNATLGYLDSDASETVAASGATGQGSRRDATFTNRP